MQELSDFMESVMEELSRRNVRMAKVMETIFNNFTKSEDNFDKMTS